MPRTRSTCPQISRSCRCRPNALSWRKACHLAQSETGHIAIDRLKASGINAIGLRKNANRLAAVRPAVEIFPSGQVALATILRLSFEMIEASPILQHDNGAQPACAHAHSPARHLRCPQSGPVRRRPAPSHWPCFVFHADKIVEAPISENNLVIHGAAAVTTDLSHDPGVGGMQFLASTNLVIRAAASQKATSHSWEQRARRHRSCEDPAGGAGAVHIWPSGRALLPEVARSPGGFCPSESGSH